MWPLDFPLASPSPCSWPGLCGVENLHHGTPPHQPFGLGLFHAAAHSAGARGAQPASVAPLGRQRSAAPALQAALQQNAQLRRRGRQEGVEHDAWSGNENNVPCLGLMAPGCPAMLVYDVRPILAPAHGLQQPVMRQSRQMRLKRLLDYSSAELPALEHMRIPATLPLDALKNAMGRWRRQRPPGRKDSSAAVLPRAAAHPRALPCLFAALPAPANPAFSSPALGFAALRFSTWRRPSPLRSQLVQSAARVLRQAGKPLQARLARRLCSAPFRVAPSLHPPPTLCWRDIPGIRSTSAGSPLLTGTAWPLPPPPPPLPHPCMPTRA